MLRLTVKEVADFLDHGKSWVYNTLRNLGCDHVSNFLSLEEVYGLFKFSFKSKSYDKYNYNALVQKKYIKAVSVGNVVDLKELITSPEDFYDILIALKVIKAPASMFNIYHYVSRHLGISEEWKKGFKEYLYQRCCRLFLESGDVSIVFLPSRNGDLNQEALSSLRTCIENALNAPA